MKRGRESIFPWWRGWVQHRLDPDPELVVAAGELAGFPRASSAGRPCTPNIVDHFQKRVRLSFDALVGGPMTASSAVPAASASQVRMVRLISMSGASLALDLKYRSVCAGCLPISIADSPTHCTTPSPGRQR